jgi:ribose transport system substrate-binding protein
MLKIKPFLQLCLLIVIVSAGCKTRTGTETPESLVSDTSSYRSGIDLSNIRIGYSSPSLNAPYYVVLSKAIQKNVEDYGMKFIPADGQDDITKQITSVEDLLAAGANVLILNPLDPKALVPAVNDAVKSGIPVFIIDSYIDPSANYICYVQADNEGNGELIGEWIAKQLGSTEIKAALISGREGNPVGREKRLGFVRGFTETQLMLQGHANLNIVSHGWGNWTNNGGLKAMEDILVAHPDVNVLVAENDAMAMGALKAIDESGKSGKIIIAGFDGQKEAYELIIAGKIGATALNPPGIMAKLVVEAAVKYLNNERNINKVIHTPAAIITRENVDRFYDPKAIF